MTTKEIDDRIENLSMEPTMANFDRLATICAFINRNVGRLESEVAKLKQELAGEKASNKRTADIASCLANGIQPD